VCILYIYIGRCFAETTKKNKIYTLGAAEALAVFFKQ